MLQKIHPCLYSCDTWSPDAQDAYALQLYRVGRRMSAKYCIKATASRIQFRRT